MPVLDPRLAGSDQSLSAAYVAAVLPALLAHYGLDEEDILTRAGLDEHQLKQPDQLLPLVDVLRLFLVILDACGDAGLGFETGKRVKPRSYQVLGYVVLASRDLGQAIDRLVRFESLSGKLGQTRLSHENEQVILRWQCPLTGEPARFLVEAAITGWVAFMRPLLPAGLAPLAVCFRHPAPVEPERYADYFQAPVQFSAAFDGVVLDARLLQQPLNTADLEAVAAELGMPSRTLSSRLLSRGVRFQDIVDGLRQRLAELYLQDPALSLTDIALLLGFAESSSFSRAFRRWRSMSPNQWRRGG